VDPSQDQPGPAMLSAVVVIRAVAHHGHAQTIGKLLDLYE
jgi:hypothetical protein